MMQCWRTLGLALAVAAGVAGPAAAQTLPPSEESPAATTEPVPVQTQPAAAPSAVDTARAYAVTVGQSVAIDLDQAITDVVVADPEIADVIVKQPTKVFLLGRRAGTTNMFFLSPDGDVVLNARVTAAPDIAAVRGALDELQPDSRIRLKTVNNSIVMSGWTPSAEAAADAEAVVRAFLGENANVVNALRVAGEQQVLLQVRVAEIQRSTLKTLGVDTALEFGNGTLGLMTDFASPTALASGALSVGKWGIDEIAFNALETEGLAKILAEPALTAISGETANFLAGGEFPTPAGLDDDGNLIVEFREFGVALSFTPVVLANDQISLRISTEVSRVTDENQVVLPGTGGVPIRGLSVRRADSTVMLPSGGSIMIAGLLQNDEFNTIEGVPGLMDLPILGSLFRSNEFRNNRSELVVVVRSFLVRPIEFGPKLAFPTDGFVPANDLDIYLYGQLRATYGDAGDGEPAGAPYVMAGPSGFLMR